MEEHGLQQMEKYCTQLDIVGMLTTAKHHNLNYLGSLLAQKNLYFKQKIEKIHSVKLLCNWMSSKALAQLWSKMLPLGSNIRLVYDSQEVADYYIIINSPTFEPCTYEECKTIIFQMEPNMTQSVWGIWAHPNPDRFLKVFTHENSYNNVEWHIQLNVNYMDQYSVVKNSSLDNKLSTVLSQKYTDVGHVKRIDFVKAAEQYINIDVFGDNSFKYKSYKGSLPYHCKDAALAPYKYHFNAENNCIPNYFTEKIVDAILSECLCFYWGCPNIEEYIDKDAYIVLDIDNVKESIQIIQRAIETDEWSKRIDIIRNEKWKILTEKNFFSRIDSIVNNI